jgi:hypothetical protein
MAASAVIRLRRDTAANWTSNDPILALGEMGIETDSRKFKVGDGTSTWTALLYGSAIASISSGDVVTALGYTPADNAALSGKEPSIAAGTIGQYWRGDKTWQTLNKAAVGLSNVDNTSDLAKPVSTATQTALNAKQDLDATLTAFAAFNTNGLLTQTAADTFTGRTLTAGSAKISVSNGSGVAGNPTIDLGSVASTDLSDAASLYKAGGTDVAIGDGGTGASLVDPNADRILFWDDSAGGVTWLAPGANLAITATTLDVTGLATVATSGSASDLGSGTLPAGRLPAFTGDVSTSAGSSVTAIGAGIVTLAQMANMATASVIYRKTAGAGAPEVNSLATLKTDLGLTGTNSGDQTSIVGITGTLAEFNTALTGADFATGGGTVTGASSGTNTGDQSSIVGITGTKAQFDTAVTDGNILYVGDVTQYTDEMAQDAVGAMVDGSLTYVDATPLLQRAALSGDVSAPAGSNTTTIGAGKVTLAMQANMATASVVYRKTAGAGAPEVQTLATLKTDLGLTGTNSGDQTSIVGITGTKAQFDTAVTDADLATLGANTFTASQAVTGDVSVTDDAFASGWNGSVNVPTKNAIYDGVVAMVSAYRTILDTSGSHIAGRVAGLYGFGHGDPLAITGTGTLYPLDVMYIDPADYPSFAGLSAKLRVRCTLSVNDVAPTGNFTVALHPVTRPATSGGAGLVIYTIGSAVASSGVVLNTPAADSINNMVGSDFAVPAAGHYILAVTTTATVATSSHLHLSAVLQLRYT